jgi:hypothetical protein
MIVEPERPLDPFFARAGEAKTTIANATAASAASLLI